MSRPATGVIEIQAAVTLGSSCALAYHLHRKQLCRDRSSWCVCFGTVMTLGMLIEPSAGGGATDQCGYPRF